MTAAVPLSRERVIKVADSLPCAPRVLRELQDLLADTNADLGQVTMLLRRDGSLTARIIRIANGVIYGRGDPVGSLEDALARVGFREVYRLTSTASMLQLAELPLRFYPISPKALRENSLLCALLMEEMAGDLGLDARTAYTAGLLRSIGRIVLDVTAQRDLRYLRPTPIGPDGLIPWELSLFGLTSGDAAAGVLRAWRFQADVWVAIRDQFLHELPMEALPMAKLLHVVIGAADAAGFGLPGGRLYVEENGAQARAELQFTDEHIAEATQRALAKFERMKAILG
jgi:HD-like signal output (HDOD) protein